MISSQKVILEITKQISNENLTHSLIAEFTDMPYIIALKAYDIFAVNQRSENVPHDHDVHAFKIFHEMSEDKNPYWLEHCPKYIHEFPKVINILSQDSVQMDLNTHLYLINETEQKAKLIALNTLQVSEVENKAILEILDVYRNLLQLFDRFEKDFLTGIYNRQTFDQKLMQLIHTSKVDETRKTKQPINNWLAVLDIDHFKKINDNYGHMYGDEVLILFCNIMRDCFRYNDLLFRYGGEEFIVGLLNVDEKGAISAMERYRKAVENYSFPQNRHVTVSIGLAKILDNELPTSLLDRADSALYKAKDSGRNQVCVASSEHSTQPEMEEGLVELF